jgi:hypothetical protein
MSQLDDLLKKLWDDYSAINKQAGGIYQLLTKRGEKVVNDHVAFRTYGLPKVGIDVLARTFLQNGYQPKGEYTFVEKKLKARHYEHADPKYPKIFISELKVEQCSKELQQIVKKLVDQVPDEATKKWDFTVSGVPWKPVSYAVYEQLKNESEYAGWMSAFGFRANHFTVFFNSLKTFKSLVELNAAIKAGGYQMNSAGGEIKGTPQEYLEQSSTMGHPVEVQFSDGKKTIPACYYEFARRYPMPDGKLFHGFIEKSANKIFESTDNKKK